MGSWTLGSSHVSHQPAQEPKNNPSNHNLGSGEWTRWLTACCRLPFSGTPEVFQASLAQLRNLNFHVIQCTLGTAGISGISSTSARLTLGVPGVAVRQRSVTNRCSAAETEFQPHPPPVIVIIPTRSITTCPFPRQPHRAISTDRTIPLSTNLRKPTATS